MAVINTKKYKTRKRAYYNKMKKQKVEKKYNKNFTQGDY